MDTTADRTGPTGLRRRAFALQRLASMASRVQIDTLLFSLALLLFAVTRLIGLERYPIYFFTDEAVQAVQAADFVDRGFKDAQGRLFPTYFQNGTYWNLSVSVYAQIIPHELFGFSVFATRATSALIALSGTAAVGLILRDAFKVRAWWLATLFLAITPVWFLHSRTAFETVIASSLYAWFLYFYLRYRLISTWNLYPALFFGALAFYSYNSIQLVVVLTATGLALSDLRYHLQNWRVTLVGMLLLGVLVLPYVRFQLDQGNEVYLHLRTLDSYWVKPGLSLGDKLDRFLHEYRTGLSPSYWFDSNQKLDLSRHVMKGYGNILVYTAPFLALGMAECFVRIRQAPYRAILIALAVAPVGAAVVQIQATRALAVVVPTAILSGLGAALLIRLLVSRIDYRPLAGGAFLLLALTSVYMLSDSLRNGPTWFTNYGLYGVQFGAVQVTDAIKEELREKPDSRIYLSPTWTNGADTVFRFMLPGEKRVLLRNIGFFQSDKVTIPANALFVMAPEEYDKAVADPRFADVKVERTVKYPTGEDGFRFVRLRYSDQADAIFASEGQARLEPVTEPASLNGQTVSVRHSKFDIGTVHDLLDGDLVTLTRTLVANPAVIEITFPEPVNVKAVHLATGLMNLDLVVEVFTSDGAEPRIYRAQLPRSGSEPRVDLPIATGGVPVRILRLAVRDADQPKDKAHIHIRDITLD